MVILLWRWMKKIKLLLRDFFREKDYIRLQPENDYMLPIILKEANYSW